MEKKKMDKVTMSLESEYKSKLKKISKENYIPMSQLLRKWIDQYEQNLGNSNE